MADPRPVTEQIDRLFLELSQFTSATTRKELDLMRERDSANQRAVDAMHARDEAVVLATEQETELVRLRAECARNREIMTESVAALSAALTNAALGAVVRKAIGARSANEIRGLATHLSRHDHVAADVLEAIAAHFETEKRG